MPSLRSRIGRDVIRRGVRRSGDIVGTVEIEVRPGAAADRDWIVEFLKAEAGSPLQARRDALIDAAEHDAFIAIAGGSKVGLATYLISARECELSTLYANPRLAGAGTALIAKVAQRAKAAGCRRLWLITTNDNLEAMRFYQRRGFRFAAVYPGAVDRARSTLKAEIPETGDFGIPLRDEIEFEMGL